MKVVVFEKKLNNAELGKGNVHDCYIREDSDFNFNDLKFVPSEYMNFWCPKNSKLYTGIHYEKFSHENRIAGLGDFFRDFSVTAADSVIITARISDTKCDYSIDVRKKENVIVISNSKNGLEILNIEKLNLLNKNTLYNGEVIELKFLLRAKKRLDAPALTDFYTLTVNEVPFDLSKMGKMFEIKVENNQAFITERKSWKKSSFDIGE